MNFKTLPLLALMPVLIGTAFAGQAPGAASAPDIPISSKDRVYLSDQSSNTVSVVDPATEKLVGVIKLGDLTPGNLAPLYKGQLLVHGMGFSPDHKTLDVVSIGSNSVTFIDTATNKVKHTTYVGRSPHEAFFTPDGREIWVTIRGEDRIGCSPMLEQPLHTARRRGPLKSGVQRRRAVGHAARDTLRGKSPTVDP